MASANTPSSRLTAAQILAPERQAAPVPQQLLDQIEAMRMKDRVHALSRGIAVLEWVRMNQAPHEKMDDILMVLDTVIRTCQDVRDGMMDHATP